MEFITLKKIKMKKIIVLILMILPLLVGAQESKDKNTKANFLVKGNCEMCKKRIEKAALSVKGIKMATWDIPSNVISIIYDPNKTPLEEIHNTIASVGHDTALSKADDDVYKTLPMCCLYDREQE